jgi:hypothetical protein
MLGWDQCSFHKKCVGTSYIELVFAQVGYAHHIVHYGASGAGNVDAPFFMLNWDQ